MASTDCVDQNDPLVKKYHQWADDECKKKTGLTLMDLVIEQCRRNSEALQIVARYSEENERREYERLKAKFEGK